MSMVEKQCIELRIESDGDFYSKPLFHELLVTRGEGFDLAMQNLQAFANSLSTTKEGMKARIEYIREKTLALTNAYFLDGKNEHYVDCKDDYLYFNKVEDCIEYGFSTGNGHVYLDTEKVCEVTVTDAGTMLFKRSE